MTSSNLKFSVDGTNVPKTEMLTSHDEGVKAVMRFYLLYLMTTVISSGVVLLVVPTTLSLLSALGTIGVILILTVIHMFLTDSFESGKRKPTVFGLAMSISLGVFMGSVLKTSLVAVVTLPSPVALTVLTLFIVLLTAFFYGDFLVWLQN